MHQNKDAYDGDTNTGSVYDDASNINGGNPYFKHLSNDVPIGESENELKKTIKKDLDKKAEAKAKKESGVADPAPDSESETSNKAKAKAGADTAFGDAVPKEAEAVKGAAEVVGEDPAVELKKDG